MTSTEYFFTSIWQKLAYKQHVERMGIRIKDDGQSIFKKMVSEWIRIRWEKDRALRPVFQHAGLAAGRWHHSVQVSLAMERSPLPHTFHFSYCNVTFIVDPCSFYCVIDYPTYVLRRRQWRTRIKTIRLPRIRPEMMELGTMRSIKDNDNKHLHCSKHWKRFNRYHKWCCNWLVR